MCFVNIKVICYANILFFKLSWKGQVLRNKAPLCISCASILSKRNPSISLSSVASRLEEQTPVRRGPPRRPGGVCQRQSFPGSALSLAALLPASLPISFWEDSESGRCKGLFRQSSVHPALNFRQRLVLACVTEGPAGWLGSEEEEEEDVLMVFSPFSRRQCPVPLCWISARGCSTRVFSSVL